MPRIPMTMDQKRTPVFTDGYRGRLFCYLGPGLRGQVLFLRFYVAILNELGGREEQQPQSSHRI